MGMKISIDRTDDDGNELSEEQIKDRLQATFEKMREAGLLEEDKEAALCLGCGEKLDELHVRIVAKFNPDVPEVDIDADAFPWVPGLHQYVISPGMLKWATDTELGGRLIASCPKCGEEIPEMVIVEKPRHGLIFSDTARLAGKL